MRPTRTDCMQMIGRLKGTQDVLREDATKPLDALCAHLRTQSRAKCICETLEDVMAMIEKLAPPKYEIELAQGQPTRRRARRRANGVDGRG